MSRGGAREFRLVVVQWKPIRSHSRRDAVDTPPTRQVKHLGRTTPTVDLRVIDALCVLGAITSLMTMIGTEMRCETVLSNVHHKDGGMKRRALQCGTPQMTFTEDI